MNDRQLVLEFIARIQPKIERYEEKEIALFKREERRYWKCVDRKFKGNFLDLTFFYDDGNWRETSTSSISIDELLQIE